MQHGPIKVAVNPDVPKSLLSSGVAEVKLMPGPA